MRKYNGARARPENKKKHTSEIKKQIFKNLAQDAPNGARSRRERAHAARDCDSLKSGQGEVTSERDK